MLYPALDYPPPPYNFLSLRRPDEQLIAHTWQDSHGRERILLALQRWIARRRQKRVFAWVVFLSHHSILPDELFGAATVLYTVCAFL